MGNTQSTLLHSHYETLCIRRDASPQEVRHAYYRLVRDSHPDRLTGSPPQQRLNAEERTKVLNEAYEIISDPVARALYDRTFMTRAYTSLTPFQAKRPEAPEQPKQEDTPEKGKETRDPNSPFDFPGVVPHPSDYAFMAEDFLRNPPWKPKDSSLRKEHCEEYNHPPRPPASPYTSEATPPRYDPAPETPELDSEDELASDSDDDAPMYEGLSPDEWIGLEDVTSREIAGVKPVSYRARYAASPYVYMRFAEAPRFGRDGPIPFRLAGVVAKKGVSE
jgi:hypothetical protein